MRTIALMLVGIAGALVGAWPAHAADAPAIVIPGKLGVPVIINGVDASYCVVEGDWGLARPGHVPQTVVLCRRVISKSMPGYLGSYFPAFGRLPGLGRVEVEQSSDRQLPPPAEGFYREWGTQSDPAPATTEPPAHIELNVAPQIDQRRRGFRRN
jgi:hypothetical protein